MDRADLDRWKPREVARLLALLETERRYYQEMMSQLPVGLVVVSSELWLVSSNRFFRQMFGLKADELARLRLADILRVDDLNEQIAEVVGAGTPQHNVLYSPPGDSPTRFFRVSILPVRNWEDEMETEALLVFEDVTGLEQQAAPAAPPTAAAEPPLQLAPQPVPAAPAPGTRLEDFEAMIWECDAALALTDISAYAEDLLGHTPKQLLSDPALWGQRVHPEDAAFVHEMYQDALAARRRLHIEYRCRTAGGKTVWVRDLVRFQRNLGGEIVKVSGVTVDIGEDRQYTERTVLAHKMDSLGRLANRVGHDYNNFLMIISGYGDDLLHLLPPENPLRADVEQIVNAAEKVHDLTNKLLSFSRRPVPKQEIFDFAQLTAEVLQGFTPDRLGPVEMVRILDPEVGSVEADGAQLEKALATLIGAALRGANQQGFLTVETAREECEAVSGEGPAASCVTLSIGASGWETDKETKRRLFEPLLMQAADGAPLSEAYWFVRQNRGEISVQGEMGQGTTIRVAFPAVAMRRAPAPPRPVTPQPSAEPQPAPVPEAGEAEVPPSEMPAPEPEPIEMPAPAPAPARTVLVVEDEEGIRALMRKILVRNGFEVIEADGGRQALALAQQHSGHLDLLVTDLVMPEMSGRELAEQLRAFLPDLRVVFASGYTDDAVIHSGSLPPGTAYLQKPFTLGALLDKVKEVLENR